MMNKKLIAAIIGLLWVLLALGMIASKQHTLRTGKIVVLETVPVDPRDFLRGDYVVLSYKISRLDLNQIESEKPFYRRGENVYVRLKAQGRFWQAVAVQSKKSSYGGAMFIKGRVEYCYDKQLTLNYGIESYFVPEGQGREIEKNMTGSKSSVSVEAIVDSGGNALIKKVYIDR